MKTADFPYKLERSILNLFRSNWRIKVEKRFDVPAHSRDLGGISLNSLHFPFDGGDSPFVSRVATGICSYVVPADFVDFELEELQRCRA